MYLVGAWSSQALKYQVLPHISVCTRYPCIWWAPGRVRHQYQVLPDIKQCVPGIHVSGGRLVESGTKISGPARHITVCTRYPCIWWAPGRVRH
ncbi:hypothetical protein RRG08_050420 [Elysia crispata]|uniref:Uncharacterized protein n=1 Tax=Elysia crispata TaxID=231223 RepID=A0AAE0ZL05_9GAST|nr:hypothetical protein RRG08_050420 [Elysia crispata]